ncbi:MAG TPA: hypothetical protein GX707_14155, partial [Epulopiscium sp.]|nr:hypothetical protein [Candidatus Epulonipiscium sp.]
RETRKLSTELSTGGKKTVHFGSMLNSTFKSILRRLFIYNLIMKGIKGIASAMSSALNTNSQYANSLNLIKTNLKVAFQPIYDFILPAINALMKGLGTATTYIASAVSAMFGKTYEQSYAAAKKLDSAKKSMNGYGSAVKKAGKDAKGATASFDTLNTLDLSKDEDIGGGGGLDGSDFAPIPELTDPGFSKLSGLAKEFYDNWGSKDIVDGIKEGLELVNFSAIQDNFQETLEGWGEIAETAFKSTQPVFKAGGELLGTRLKYGIAIAGNALEPMTKGLANFTTNMKGPIKDWIKETSSTVTDGINNMTSVTETVGQSWLGSVLKYKPKIEKETEKTFTNMANHAMLNGTVMADSFNIVTVGIKKFVEENEIEINLFTDSILQMFTDMWGLVNNVWEDSLNILGAFWDEWGKGIVEGVMEVLSDIGEWFLHLWNDLVKPVWDEMLSWVQEMWDDTFKGIFEVLLETVGKVWDLIKVLWDKIFKPLVDLIIIFFVPAFKNGFSTILGVIKAAVKGIGTVIKGLLKALGGVIDFIVGVFTGDWSRAWEGIKDIFGGIFESLVGLVKAPINAIIAIINGMVGGVVGGIN